MSPRTHRRKAREAAMQAIFQLDQNPATSRDYVLQFLKEELRFPELEAFAMRLVDGVQEHRGRIDALLAESAVNWKVERMAAVDRAILRLGVYEMGVAHPPTPPRVVITEAVEIAKRFSTQDSARFVNGVLDRIAQTIPPAEQTNEDSTPADEHEVEDDPPTIDDPEQQ